MIKKRSAGVASLFNFIAPGLGYLYMGKPVYALIYPFTLVLTLGFFTWSKLIFQPIGFAVTFLVLALLVINGIVTVCIMARRSEDVELKKFQRWYVYCIFLISFSLLWGWVTDNRARVFGYESYKILSGSMASTLKRGDFVISNTWMFNNQRPTRGEVVSHTWNAGSKYRHIGRIIGLPGDAVERINGQLKVNNVVLTENYIDESNNAYRSKSFHFEVPDGSYFILGDNRDNSSDSRGRGFVLEENLIGSVASIWFSFDREEGVKLDRIGMLGN
jgi:signal peptidase I